MTSTASDPVWFKKAMQMTSQGARIELLKSKEWQKGMQSLSPTQVDALMNHVKPHELSAAMNEALKEVKVMNITVLVEDLVKRPDLNMRVARVVEECNKSTGRIGVEFLETKERVRVRTRNLTPITLEDLQEIKDEKLLTTTDMKLFLSHWKLDPPTPAPKPEPKPEPTQEPGPSAALMSEYLRNARNSSPLRNNHSRTFRGKYAHGEKLSYRDYNEQARPTDQQISVEKERIAKISREMRKIQAKLDDKNFTLKAPEPLVAKYESRIEELKNQKRDLEFRLDERMDKRRIEMLKCSEDVRQRTRRHADTVQRMLDERGVERPKCQVCGEAGQVGVKCCGQYNMLTNFGPCGLKGDQEPNDDRMPLIDRSIAHCVRAVK